ncbi:hypothetical protein HS041_28045 [Planomonospora sp. ID67723]|uniref:hypothetical protein n=1 Tax=Planomonospora sp. ID67723 TaxID=2738134 RepID=UPI0018C42DF6|nr:hypothetical protein [Planomonospora sp. ID67723]MBG0831589.1 hypothetical protein [Planomonospora sp. ID67723]
MKRVMVAGVVLAASFSAAYAATSAAWASPVHAPTPDVIEPDPGPEDGNNASPSPQPPLPQPTVTVTVTDQPSATPAPVTSSPAPSSSAPAPPAPASLPPLEPVAPVPTGTDATDDAPAFPEATPSLVPAPPMAPTGPAPAPTPFASVAPITSVSSVGDSSPDAGVELQLAVPALMLILAVIAGLIAVDRRTPRRRPASISATGPRERHIGQHRAP